MIIIASLNYFENQNFRVMAAAITLFAGSEISIFRMFEFRKNIGLRCL